MKIKMKLLSITLAIAMIAQMIAVITLPAFAWNWKEDGNFEVASYDTPIVEEGTINVDVELEDAYLEGTKIVSYPDEEPFFRDNGGIYESVRELGDASFIAYTAVDTTGLYVYAEIADTTIFETLNTNGNDGDCFQLFLDWCRRNARGGRTHYKLLSYR